MCTKKIPPQLRSGISYTKLHRFQITFDSCAN
nr:MAG TPA: hypothetical protein [Caudoviricetes sp.]